MRILLLLVIALFGASCFVPPSCIDRSFVPGRTEHFASLMIFAGPLENPKRHYSTGMGMWERFERGASIHINTEGRMTITELGPWPRSCPTASREDLAEVARYWQPILGRIVKPCSLQVMANPYTWKDDWRPDGPFIEISFGPASGKNFGLMWDGQSKLPKELDTAVIGTLEMICSNSSLARKYLFRDLPRQTSDRLECGRKKAR